MEIKIVVACFKKDIHIARICVASVRYWYPDIDIYLLKDLSFGDFSNIFLNIENLSFISSMNNNIKHFFADLTHFSSLPEP